MSDAAVPGSAQAEVSAGKRFAFGRNWKRFLGDLDNAQIEAARNSLLSALGALDGRTFLDVGSGSGLFSFAAASLGARVHSFDFDTDSVECTQRMRGLLPEADWSAEQGSILDPAYVDSLGRRSWDVVYAWGVLHHTGDLERALANAADLVADEGQLLISIYNDQGFRSTAWRYVKRAYNHLPEVLRRPVTLAILGPRELLARVVRGPQPRGMSRYHDMADWMGGYPFEPATPEAVFRFLRPRGFQLEALSTTRSWGCNEYRFSRHR